MKPLAPNRPDHQPHRLSLLRVTAIGTALCLSALGAQAQQKLLPASSEIAFVSKQMGVPVEGNFKRFDAHVARDEPNDALGIDRVTALLLDIPSLSSLYCTPFLSQFPRGAVASD